MFNAFWPVMTSMVYLSVNGKNRTERVLPVMAWFESLHGKTLAVNHWPDINKRTRLFNCIICQFFFKIFRIFALWRKNVINNHYKQKYQFQKQHLQRMFIFSFLYNNACEKRRKKVLLQFYKKIETMRSTKKKQNTKETVTSH